MGKTITLALSKFRVSVQESEQFQVAEIFEKSVLIH